MWNIYMVPYCIYEIHLIAQGHTLRRYQIWIYGIGIIFTKILEINIMVAGYIWTYKNQLERKKIIVQYFRQDPET